MSLPAAQFKLLVVASTVTYDGSDYVKNEEITFADDQEFLRAARVLGSDTTPLYVDGSLGSVELITALREAEENVIAAQQGLADPDDSASMTQADQVNFNDKAAGVALGIHDLQSLIDSLKTAGLIIGSIPAARLVMSAQPTNTQTVVIGAHTFTFVTTLGAVSTNTQIEIGADAAADRASLIKAINGITDDAIVHGTVAQTTDLVADEVGTSVRIRKANRRGGDAVPGTVPTCALSDTVAGAWSVANLNASGRALGLGVAYQEVAITAAMVTAGGFQVEFPFTPLTFLAQVKLSTGALSRATTDLITISGDAINIALAGGASPNIQAGDLVQLLVLG